MPLPTIHCVVAAALLRGWPPWLRFVVAYPPWNLELMLRWLVVVAEVVAAVVADVESLDLAT